MGSKIFSSILCRRLFRIIDTHGVKYQFGSTLGVGYQDGSFTIETMLHLRHNYHLPTWILFVDLVKAFDTYNHALMDKLLERYGCPPALCSSIARIYKDSKVRLIIGEIDTTIPFHVSVKQEDSMAPVLFLFIIIGFAETLEKEWLRNDLTPLQFRQYNNSPLSKGYITSHKRSTFSKGTLFDIFCILYVDDGAFRFPSREELGNWLRHRPPTIHQIRSRNKRR